MKKAVTLLFMISLFLIACKKNVYNAINNQAETSVPFSVWTLLMQALLRQGFAGAR